MLQQLMLLALEVPGSIPEASAETVAITHVTCSTEISATTPR